MSRPRQHNDNQDADRLAEQAAYLAGMMTKFIGAQ